MLLGACIRLLYSGELCEEGVENRDLLSTKKAREVWQLCHASLGIVGRIKKQIIAEVDGELCELEREDQAGPGHRALPD